MKKCLSAILNPTFIILLAALLRLVPHIPNVTPISAMALFGGLYLNKKYALMLPLLAMVLSDVVLGFSLITPFVYGSLLATGVIGLWIKDHKQIQTILLASLFSSFLFFVVTNTGVWLVWNFYPKTGAGLFDCLVAGLPFFRNTVLGDLFYTTVIVGGYQLIQLKIQHTRLKSI